MVKTVSQFDVPVKSCRENIKVFWLVCLYTSMHLYSMLYHIGFGCMFCAYNDERIYNCTQWFLHSAISFYDWTYLFLYVCINNCI